ncbi:MAG: DUF115 domain-containing protein [Treponema sp.]|jgi:hypothetical protein|nr:DUF115 domain-containing protein [Treponema sp.]
MSSEKMSYWEINKAVCDKHYPGLIGEITRDGDDLLAEDDIKVEQTAAGVPTLIVKGTLIHSRRDPVRESRRLAEAECSSSGVIVILGFGLGYAAEAAVDGKRPLIIVEKYRSLLKTALRQRDLSELLLNNKLIFVLGGSGEGINNALAAADELCCDKSQLPVIRNRALTGLDENWYSVVEKRIRAWGMKDKVNTATLERFGKRWVGNLSRNMSAIRDCPGISRLDGLCADNAGATITAGYGAIDSSIKSNKAVNGTAGNGITGNGIAGKTPDSGIINNSAVDSDVPCNDTANSGYLPVFLAAAGPGLDKAAPLLRDIYSRCLIVAVDTSLSFFNANGIEPDFVIVVDPQFWNSRHLDRCVCGKRTRLIAESAVYPSVLRLPFKNIFLCGSMFPMSGFIEKQVDPKGQLGAGGSVATTAWDFARRLGTAEIWIAGLDLAFPELKTHFRGALFENRSHSLSKRFFPAETMSVRALRDGFPFYAPSNAGGQVLTDKRLSLYAAWFENRVRQYNVRSLNLFPGGLSIKGIENVAVDKLLALPKRRGEINFRLDATFSDIENDFYSPDESSCRAQRYETAIAALLRGLEKIKTSCEKGAFIASLNIHRSLSPAQQDKILKELDSVTRLVTESDVKEAAGFLFPDFKITEDSSNPFLSYLKSSKKLFSSLAQSASCNLEKLSYCENINGIKFF